MPVNYVDVVFPMIVSAAVVFSQFILPHIYTYELNERYFRCLFFGRIESEKIAISDIEGMQVYDWTDPTKRWSFKIGVGGNCSNRIFARQVILKKRSGLVKWIIITPDKPEEFVQRFYQLKTISQEPKSENAVE